MLHPLLTRKLPDCPRCGEDELWCNPGEDIRVRCYFCGWDSGAIVVRRCGDAASAVELAVCSYHVESQGER